MPSRFTNQIAGNRCDWPAVPRDPGRRHPANRPRNTTRVSAHCTAAHEVSRAGSGFNRRVVVPFAAAVIAVTFSGCQGIGSSGYDTVSYEDLTQNIQQFHADQKKVELHGQVIEFVETTDYQELGSAQYDPIAFTVEGFLLHVGEPLPESTLKRVGRLYHHGAGYLGNADLAAILKGQDLQLVLVRWTAPYDIPQREKPGSDPYPVTPGSTVTVQGVASQGKIEQWKHCRHNGDYGCTNLRGVAGPTVEAEIVGDIPSEQFGYADGPLGSN